MSMAAMDALIIRHLGDLDVAAKRLKHDVHVRVTKAIAEMAENWTKEQNWEGEFDIIGDYLWVAPGGWRVSDEDAESYYLWFEFRAGEGDDQSGSGDTDYFWLTRLLGAGSGKLGFRCAFDIKQFGKKRDWTNFVQSHIESIQKVGFSYESSTGTFFMPVCIGLEEMAKAIEEDAIEEALTPFGDALNRLRSLQPVFDTLLAEAKKHFKVS